MVYGVLEDHQAWLRKRQKILGIEMIKINVGGYIYKVPWKIIANAPSSRLARLGEAECLEELKSLVDDFDNETNEMFFDRHCGAFDAVINFYRTFKLHMPEDMCPIYFKDELAFWGVNDIYLEGCCQGLKTH
jgi:hypothetical protein